MAAMPWVGLRVIASPQARNRTAEKGHEGEPAQNQIGANPPKRKEKAKRGDERCGAGSHDASIENCWICGVIRPQEAGGLTHEVVVGEVGRGDDLGAVVNKW